MSENVAPSRDDAAARTNTSRQVSLVLGAVFVAFLAQMTLNPVVAPLAREVGLAEWQLGLTISMAAIMVVTTSRMWGRRSQSLGRKPVLVAALTLAALVTALFALTAWLGMRGLIGTTVTFALFVLLRGVGFGTAIAAVPTTAQAFIATITHDERSRVKGMAGVGAAQGMAMVGGSLLGAVLSTLGLMAPLVAVPLLLAAGGLLLAVRLQRQPREELIVHPPQVRWSDPRVRPFLIAGFGMFTALGFIQIVTGFLVQDRFDVSGSEAATLTGIALVVAGVGMIVAQTVLVPRSGWSPVRLLRTGAGIAAVGFATAIADLGLAVFLVALALIGFGLGVAIPGYVAGPSLRLAPQEQGGLAGLISANNGLTFVVAPAAGTALYGVWPALPIIVGTTAMLGITGYTLLAPAFKSRTIPSLPR